MRIFLYKFQIIITNVQQMTLRNEKLIAIKISCYKNSTVDFLPLSCNSHYPQLKMIVNRPHNVDRFLQFRSPHNEHISFLTLLLFHNNFHSPLADSSCKTRLRLPTKSLIIFHWYSLNSRQMLFPHFLCVVVVVSRERRHHNLFFIITAEAEDSKKICEKE